MNVVFVYISFSIQSEQLVENCGTLYVIMRDNFVLHFFLTL